MGDHVVSHSGSVHGRIISDDGADILVREHGAHGGIVVGKRRYWHHDPDGVVVVVDRRGEVMGPFTRQQADEYAELWDRDCPDGAPHVVKTREEVRRRKRGRRQS